MRACEPRAELERRPLLAPAAERHEHGTVGGERHLPRRERDVARRRADERGVGQAADDEQLRVLLGRKAREVACGVCRGEARRPRRDRRRRERRGARRELGRVACERHEHELASVGAERRHERRERQCVADNRPADRALLGRRERGVVAQDRALELLQRRARLDPELLHEQPPPLAVGRERVRLAPGPVQRRHQLTARLLPQRLLLDELRQLADEALVLAELELGLDPLRERA